LADQVRRSAHQSATVLLEGGLIGDNGMAFFKPTTLGGVNPGMAAFDELSYFGIR